MLLLPIVGALFCGNQQAVLKDYLQHGRRVGGGGKAPCAGELEVKGKGGVGGAGVDVHQVVILLILEELPVGSADLELWGGADAHHSL